MAVVKQEIKFALPSKTSLKNCVTRKQITRELNLKHFGTVYTLSILLQKKMPGINQKQVVVKSEDKRWSAHIYIDKEFPEAGPVFLDTGAIPEQLDTDDYKIEVPTDIGGSLEMIFTVEDHYAWRKVQIFNSDTIEETVRLYLIEHGCFLTVGSLLYVSEWFSPGIIKLDSVIGVDPETTPDRVYLCNRFTRVTVVQNPQKPKMDLFIGVESILESVHARIKDSLDIRKESPMQTLLLHGPSDCQLKDFSDGLPSVFVGRTFNIRDLYAKKGDADAVKGFFEKAFKRLAGVILIPELDKTHEEFPEYDKLILEILLKAKEKANNFMVIATAVDCDEINSDIREHFFHERVEFPYPDENSRRALIELYMEQGFDNRAFQYLLIKSEGNTSHEVKCMTLDASWIAKRYPPKLISRDIIRKQLCKYPPWGKPLLLDIHNPYLITLRDFVGFKEFKADIRNRFNLSFDHREKMMEFNCKPPKHHLWFGAPSTGKSMMVESISQEFNIPVISVIRKDVFSKYFGESEKNLTKIFTKAKKMAPCIIHFKSFEGIAARNGDISSVEGRIVNHLKVLLDGVEGCDEDVFVIAETNMPLTLDTNAIRHGRFNCYKHFKPPSREDIEEAIRYWLPGILEEDMLQYAVEKLEGALMPEIKTACYDIQVEIDYPGKAGIIISKDLIDRNTKTYEPTQCMEDCEKFAREYL